MVQDLNHALSDLEDFFNELFADPQGFATQGVVDLINAAQALVDFVLNLLDTIITKILDLVDVALGLISDILTQPLGDIPIISWLYTNVVCPSDQQEELTILRLCSLVCAFPVTLIYKFANNLNPPFDDATTQQILAQKFVPPQSMAVGAAPPTSRVPAGAAETIIDPRLLTAIYAALSTVQAGGDVAADVTSQTGADEILVIRSGWADLVTNSVMQVVSWPDGWFQVSDWSSLTEGEKLMRANWVLGWVPLLVNGVLLIAPTPTEGKIAEGIDGGGKTFLVIWGALTLGLGMAGTCMAHFDDNPPNATNYDIAASFFAPLPNLTQFLRYNSLVEASEGITLAIKLVLTFAADIAAGWLPLGDLHT